MNIYPLVMEPSFRSGPETPWGGTALKEKFGKNTPEEATGESLEISALPGHESRAANGELLGCTLQEIFLLWGSRMTGTEGKTFPLLLKLLDARQALSVQVHPDDAYALAHEGKRGKTEAWYILGAEPGAKLVFGTDTRGEPLRSVVEDGRLESCLRWVDARPGDVFYIPSGTIHALGPGIQCYEIQESSDVTYRFWDWGRTGKDGRPRELHTEKALAVSNTGPVPGQVSPAGRPVPGGLSTLLADDPHFQLYAADLDGTFSTDAGRMQFLTPTVPCTVSWDTSELALAPYRSMLIPADMGPVRLSGRGRVLISRIP